MVLLLYCFHWCMIEHNNMSILIITSEISWKYEYHKQTIDYTSSNTLYKLNSLFPFNLYLYLFLLTIDCN